MKKTALILIIASATVLTAFGVLFCWSFPTGTGIVLGSSHWMTKRMIAGNLIGLASGVMAIAVGWRRWLKFAPTFVIAWVGLLLYAATIPSVQGRVGWIRFGPIAFCIWEALPLVSGLGAAWISWKCHFRSFVTILIIAIPLAAFFGMKIIPDKIRLQRERVYWGQGAAVQKVNAVKPEVSLQQKTAWLIQESKWFGKVEHTPRRFHCAATAAMPAMAASMYGRWCLVLLVCVVGLMGSGFVLAWKATGENEKRALALAQGLSLVGAMILSFLGNLNIISLVMFGIPWASFGGSMAAFSWLALGVLASAMLDKFQPPKRRL